MLSKQQRMEKLDRLQALDGAVISTRDKTIYRSHYGLDDGIEKSLAETGKIFKMTKEGVRLIVRKIDELITN